MEDRSPSWFQLFQSYWRSRYSSWQCWSINDHSSQWRRTGIRYKMGWHFMIDYQNSHRWCPGEFVKVENTRVWSTQNRLRIVWHGNSSEDVETWLSQQKMPKPDYHKLKTMVKGGFGQKLRSRNFEAINGRIETGAAVKNRNGKRSVVRGLGECWQLQASGQCSKANNCSFRHDENKRLESTPKSTQSSEPLKERDEMRERVREEWAPDVAVHLEDHLERRAGSTWKVIEQIHLAVTGIHPNACTSVLRNNRVNSLKWMVTRLQWLCWRIHDKWDMRISGRRTAEVFIGFTEEHKSLETN